MTEIYVIRHVQAEGNLYRMCQGHWDGDVTPVGVQQRDALAERFRDVPVNAIYSSDLYRARFTASAITKYHPLPINTDRRFREIDLGPWETKYFGNLRREDGERFNKFIYDQPHFFLEGAETYAQVADRAYAALLEAVEKHPDQTLVITAHGITIRCMLSRVGGFDIADTEHLPLFMNTGVAKLRWDKGSFTIDYLNDCSHLSPQLQRGMKGPDLRHEYINPAAQADYYKHCYEQAWLVSHGELKNFNAETYLGCALEHYLEDPEAVSHLYYEDESAGLLDLDTRRGAHAGYGWISLIYLEPEFRHSGCGIQLLSRAMLKYSRLGRKSLRLHVAEENTDAINFYRRWGFELLSREPGSSGCLLLMEKKLVSHEHA